MKENWKYKKLGEIASFSRGLTYSKNDVAIHSTKMVLRSNNIDLDTNLLNLNDIAYLNDDFVIPEDKKLHKNNIFICMSNGSTQHLGKVAFIKDDLEYAFGGFMGAITPNNNETEPKYVFYSCLSKEYKIFLKTVLNGININNLKWSDLKDFSIPVPPLPVQRQIVAELDLLSDIIEKQKQQIAELDKLAQATFYDMFGDPVTNEKGWEKSELGKICDVRDGTHDSPEYYEHGFPLVTSKNIIDGCISFDNVNYICEEDYLKISKRSHVDNGDIIMPMIGTIGKPVIVKKSRDFAIKNVALIKFIKDSKANNIFIQAIMSSRAFDDYMKGKNKGGTQKFIALGDIRKLDIPVPPLQLQQSFASKIEAIERQKELISNSIKESRKLFDSRMEHWFG